MVDTPAGPVAIENIQPGDVVITKPENNANAPVTRKRVRHVFTRIAPAIIWLTFANGQSLGLTPDHTVWTENAGWTQAGELTIGDAFVTTDECSIPIDSIHRDESPAPTYNFAVDGTSTFFVHGLWVHNTSCPNINQVAQKVRRGHGPRTISRVDKGNPDLGELPHIHFDDGSALNVDGTWKHGSKALTNAEKSFLLDNGWVLP